MSIVKVSPSGQVRIPKEVMKRLNISTGDYLDFDFIGNTVVVKPKKLIDADQLWFWTKEWQEAEIKAEEDIKEGNVSKVFSSAKEGISYLMKIRKEINKSKKAR